MASGKFDSNTPGVPAVLASATAPGSNGVHGITSNNVASAGYFEHTDAGIGVFSRGGPNGGSGVHGISTGPDFPGVFGESAAGNGVEGFTASGASGVKGRNTNTVADLEAYDPTSTNPGVFGDSASGTGVIGISSLAGRTFVPGGVGVVGSNDQFFGTGVRGQANGDSGRGVFGQAIGDGGIGVIGFGGNTGSGIGVYGTGSGRSPGTGVKGDSFSGVGVEGSANEGPGVVGTSVNGEALAGYGGNVGVHAHNNASGNDAYLGTIINSGDFYGEVSVHGRLNKFGGGFRIDHPLDPGAKCLSHSFVESSDMKNIYDGIAVLDAGGEAEIELPSWFDTHRVSLSAHLHWRPSSRLYRPGSSEQSL